MSEAKEKPKRLERIDPDSKEYRRLKYEIALKFCNPIHPCRDCGRPVVRPYCCTFCGSVDP